MELLIEERSSAEVLNILRLAGFEHLGSLDPVGCIAQNPTNDPSPAELLDASRKCKRRADRITARYHQRTTQGFYKDLSEKAAARVTELTPTVSAQAPTAPGNNRAQVGTPTPRATIETPTAAVLAVPPNEAIRMPATISSPNLPNKIISWNVGGLSTSLAQVEKLRSERNPDILVLNETWYEPHFSFPSHWRHESACLPKAKNNRSHGGVTMIVKNNICFKLLFKIARRFYQLVAISFNGATVVGAYIAPEAPPSDLSNFIELISRKCSGRTMVIGDLNARNKNWDDKSNRRGTTLRHWAYSHGWEIHAPNEYTYISERGRSVVDIMLTRARNSTRPSIEAGPWEGCSDLRPISIETSILFESRRGERRISKARRKREDLGAIASKLQLERWPSVLSQLEAAQTMHKVDNAVQIINQTLVEPYRPKGKAPVSRRFKEFWSNPWKN